MDNLKHHASNKDNCILCLDKWIERENLETLRLKAVKTKEIYDQDPNNANYDTYQKAFKTYENYCIEIGAI